MVATTASVELGDLVTITNVPLLTIGIEYPASTGPVTFTPDMFADILASQDDPHIPATRIKLGHNPNSIDQDLQALWEQTQEDQNDSTPAVGTIGNMHLSADGYTLLGDLVGIPEWLANIMASAYPARSIEGGSWLGTANFKEYGYTLQALALLGVAWPGCTNLEDLQVLFSKDGPEVQVIEMSAKPKEATHMTVVAQVNAEDVRRAFYEDVAVDERYWWWDRQLLLEPNEMIASDPDTGQLYRIPFSIKGDEVTWSDPVAVKIEYVDQPQKAGDKASVRVAMAMLPNAGKVIASNQTRAEAYAGFREEQPETTEEDQMDPKAIRERLGLPEDASDEAVFARLDELKPDEEPEVEPVEEPAVEQPEAEPVAAAAKGVKTIDEETYNRLMSGAQTAEKLAAEKRTGQRDTEIAAAIKDGRIPPARKEHWEAQYEADFEGASATLKSLSPGTIPVNERGSSVTTDDSPSGEAYDRSWLSVAERQRVEAAEKGDPRNPRITVEA